MKEIKFIVFYLALSALFYIIFCFGTAEFNFTKWALDARVSLSIIFSFSALGFIAAYFLGKDESV